MSHPRFRPRMHDVYNVINHGEELKVKAPPSIWLCMFGNGDIADGLSCYLAPYNLTSCKPTHQLK